MTLKENGSCPFLEYEMNEIEEAQLIPGEDETLESAYRKMANSRKIMEAANTAHHLTGGDGSTTEQIGRALREITSVAEYDSELEQMQNRLEKSTVLLNDLNRELAAYISDGEFDEETFYETEKRLDVGQSFEGQVWRKHRGGLRRKRGKRTALSAVKGL